MTAEADPMGLSSSVRVQITGCPDTPALVEAMPKNASPAQWMYARIAQAIVAFEKQLDQQHEVGFHLVNIAGDQTMHVLDVGYWAPDLILFFGRAADGSPMQLMQHVTQVSLLLVAARKPENEEPRRIGFDILRRVEESAKETAGTEGKTS
jgi:hypothetical protein